MIKLNKKYEFMAEDKWRKKIEKIMSKIKSEDDTDHYYWKKK